MAALPDPWHQTAGSRLRNRRLGMLSLLYKCGNEERFAKQRTALEACEFFRQPLFFCRRVGTLELQITKELVELGILKS